MTRTESGKPRAGQIHGPLVACERTVDYPEPSTGSLTVTRTRDSFQSFSSASFQARPLACLFSPLRLLPRSRSSALLSPALSLRLPACTVGERGRFGKATVVNGFVQKPAIGEVFSVVESWKGDLKPGESVELPDLKPNENALALSPYPKDGGFQDKSEISEQVPRQPIGSGMILFLKKQKGSGAETPVKCGPDSTWDGMKVSVPWIDDGKAFCFQQWMNPGPSALSQCMRGQMTSSDVVVFTTRIQEVLRVERDLGEALALKNANVRGHRFGRIALRDVYQAQKEAMNALAKAGTGVVPWLRIW